MKLPWQKKPKFFSASEEEQLIAAIQQAERKTSGEVRLFIESHCRFVNPLDRATEIFLQLGMVNTEERNATLIYVAVKDKQAAVLGDEGIYQKLGQQYWNDIVTEMMLYFKKENLAEGISECIARLGEALHHYFPFDRDTDKNELPDEIVFGT